MTTGTMLLFGGIGGIAVSLLTALISFILLRRSKKKVIQKITARYE